MADVRVVIILWNMTQLTLELCFICHIACSRLGIHDANQSGTFRFPELASCSGICQFRLKGIVHPGSSPTEESHYMLPREYILGPLCSSAGSTGTSRPRRTRCGTWSAGGGCPLSLGSRQEENTAWANVDPREEAHSVSAVIIKQWKPHFASNQPKSKWFLKDVSLSLRSWKTEKSNHVYSENTQWLTSVLKQNTY